MLDVLISTLAQVSILEQHQNATSFGLEVLISAPAPTIPTITLLDNFDLVPPQCHLLGHFGYDGQGERVRKFVQGIFASKETSSSYVSRSIF